MPCQRPPRHARAAAALVARAVGAEPVRHQDYAQVAFNSPFQAGTTSAPVRRSRNFPGGRQIFSRLPRRAADLRHHRPLPLLGRASERTRALAGDGGGLFSCGERGQAARRPAAGSPRRGLEQPLLQRLQPRRALDLRAVRDRSDRRRRPRARHRWRYGRCGSTRRESEMRPGELEQQGRAVARIDLDHRIAVRGLVIDEHGGLDREGLGAAQRQARAASRRPTAPGRPAPRAPPPRAASSWWDRRTGRARRSWTRKLSSAMPSSVVWMRASMMLPPARLIAPASR